jgi:hypothetical protein
MDGIVLMNMAVDFQRPLRDKNDLNPVTSHVVAGYLPVVPYGTRQCAGQIFGCSVTLLVHSSQVHWVFDALNIERFYT